MRHLAQHLGVNRIIANRLDFRDGISTGRLLEPVIRPGGMFARVSSSGPEGTRPLQKLADDLGISPAVLEAAVAPASRTVRKIERPIVYFDGDRHDGPLSVRSAFRGKQILLIGVTGFIGKVWLVNALMDLPEVGCIYLLIRRQKSTTAESRFQKLVEESPVFDPLYERCGHGLAQFLKERVRVIEGDVTQAGLGLSPDIADNLRRKLDLIVNSSGLTDFNPDLRAALSANVDAVVNVLKFIVESGHGGLLHLSTCYIAGARDGRVSEKVRPDYTPARVPQFDAEQEWNRLHRLVEEIETRAEGPAVAA